MNYKRLVSVILASIFVLNAASCSLRRPTESTAAPEIPSNTIEAPTLPSESTVETTVPTATPEPTPGVKPTYIGLSAEEIVELMTLEEKASQMVQGTNYNLSRDEMSANCYGSVLSYDGNWPSIEYSRWHNIISNYQIAALSSDTGIPFIYGNDCLHGLNMVIGNTIFPHNINLGAANDVELMREMGVITGSNMLYTGMLWNFAPCVAAAQDPRWGRTYESYSSDNSIIEPLALAFTEGLMDQGIIPCPKHFFGDGYVVFGTGEGDNLIDRGDASMTQDQIDECLALYQSLIDLGVQSIMISHSSLDGTKMHEYEFYINYLKTEMGFEGVVLSDWDSIHNCSGETLKDNVIHCVNCGIDMFMEETTYEEVRDYIIEGVNEGLISEERINDAVTRILKMKMAAGLFEDPYQESRTPAYDFNSDHEHEVARTLATESMVPLKLNSDVTLTEGMRVFVTGPASDDTGVLCGGWTYVWQGGSDADLGMRWCAEGPSILRALQTAADEIGFEIVTDESEIDTCDVVILVVGEMPYAEWLGDSEDISITGALALEGNLEAIELAANSGLPTTTLIVAGRNVIISDYIDSWDNVIMCYLPGSEGGNAVADILTGNATFSGHLAMPYYSSVDQIGTGRYWLGIGYSAADEA